MFTLEQLTDIHDRLGKASTLPAYLDALRAIGVERSESFITDGHTEHHGHGHVVSTAPAHELLVVAATRDHEGALKALEESDYLKMSKALADSGVEKWTFDTGALTITYYDKSGAEVLKENVT